MAVKSDLGLYREEKRARKEIIAEREDRERETETERLGE